MLARGGEPERLVRSFGSVLRLPLPKCLPERWQVEIAVVARPDRAAGGAGAALDAPVELRAARWCVSRK